MAYSIPGVNVYEVLQNPGGAADTSPSLEGCIIGPAYNVISYVAGDTSSAVLTSATSATTGTASIVAGSNILTFPSTVPFSVGDSIFVAGAGASSTVTASANASSTPIPPLALNATITQISGNIATLSTPATNGATNASVTKKGFITNNKVINSFNLPGQVVGQVVNVPSIQPYVTNALVQTLSLGFMGYAGNNAIVYSSASGTASATAPAQVLTGVTNPTQFVVGDPILLTGAGAAGAPLAATITNIVGSTFTINTPVVTTVTSAVLAKAASPNLSATTSTLMIEPGDQVLISYTNNVGVASTFATTTLSVVPATTNLTNITLNDILPPDLSIVTSSSVPVPVAASTLTLASATGFNVGDTILIQGAGAGGIALEAQIVSLTGAVAGISVPAVSAIPVGAVVTRKTLFTLQTRKLFNNQLIPSTKPISGGNNYDTTNTGTTGVVNIEPLPELAYGVIQSGEVHFAYRALRTDLSGTVLTINDQADLIGQLGTVNQYNPLALALQIALANTSTRMRAIAVPVDSDAGYLQALNTAQSQRIYYLTPLTQSLVVGTALAAHTAAMSTPVNALWRVGIYNSQIPSVTPVGIYNAAFVNANGGNNAITLVNGNYVLTATNATFITDGVVPGDLVTITAGVGAPSPLGTIQVLNVVSNQQVVVQASGTATAVSYYITRNLSNTQRAAAVANTSTTFGSNRLIHTQPDSVTVSINGASVVVPGYYLSSAINGLCTGLPSQQGLTNYSISGITDLQNSNFSFTRAQLDTMASAGTFLVVQANAGGIPYIRHELTTNVSVYEYRELQAVKNWDFLAYSFYDLMSPFIGQWNITPDTIGVIRQTIISKIELIKSKKLPRIGAPLIDATITTLAQNPTSTDRLTCNLSIKMPSVLNYVDMYLTI